MRLFKPLNFLIKSMLAVVVTYTGASGADMCYDPPELSGGVLCLDVLGLGLDIGGCKVTTPIRNISSSTLTSATVVKAYHGLDLSFLNGIGIDSVIKTIGADTDAAELNGTLNALTNLNGLVDLTLFDKGVIYRTGDYAPLDEHTIYTEALVGISLSDIKYLSTYTKDGVVYNTLLYPCETKLVSLTPQRKSVIEGGLGTTTPVTFTVTLSEMPTEGNLNVSYTITAGTATQGTDYSATSYSGTLTFNENTTTLSQTIIPSVLGEGIIENNETFVVTLTSLTQDNEEDFVIDDSFKTTTVTIVDDDNTSGEPIVPLEYIPGTVDTVDVYQFTSATPFYQAVIKTKIAGKTSMTLDAVYLGLNHVADVLDVYTAANMPVIMYLYDPATGSVTKLYEQANPTEPLAAVINKGQIKGTTPLFTIPATATKEAYILMRYLDYHALLLEGGPNCLQNSSTGANAVPGMPSCIASDVQYLDAFHQEAFDQCKVQHGAPCTPSFHGYSGGGDPTYPGYDVAYDHKYGCYECTMGGTALVRSADNFAIRPNLFNVTSSDSHMPNLLRSAQEYNTTVQAYNYATTTETVDYNVTDANSTFVTTLTKYNRNNIVTPTMVGELHFATAGFDMANGVSVKSGIAGHEVAGLTFDDVGKINIRLEDRAWAAIDIKVNDTTADCSASGAYICSDKNVTFIPDHFDFNELKITNNNGNPGTFTYIANEFTQMGGRIHTQMRSLNKNGNVTQNFATFPLWENSVTVTPVVTKSTYLYPDANETTINALAIGFSSGMKTIPWNESNTSQYLRFNFKRDVNLAVNFFDVNGSDLNISVASHYSDPDDSDTADINASRNADANGSARFVYGRIIPRDVRVFGNVSFNANAWYEAFNSPTLGGTQLTLSRMDTMWYINRLHNDLSDGDANVTVVITGSNPTNATAISGLETYTFGAVGSTNIPYSAKAHILTAPWLWYGVNALPYADPDNPDNLNCLTHPCFNISVVPPKGATGSAKTATEAGKKVNKATTPTPTGGTGLIYDYAPAIK